MTLQEYIREFVCQIEHFTNYVEDAIRSPDLTDFSVMEGKIQLVRRHMVGIEKQLGMIRKESKKDESKQDSPTKRPQAKSRVLQVGSPRSKGRDPGPGTRTKKTRSR